MKIRFILVLGILIIGILVTSQSCVSDPSVVIYDYELTPSVFMPGDSGTLKLTITNAETTNTVSKTTVSGPSTTVSTDTVGAIFTKIWLVSASDKNDKLIKSTIDYKDAGELAPAASFEVTFDITAENGIIEDLYFPNVKINLESYTDVSFPIPIKVSNTSVDIIPKSVPSKISLSGETELTLNIVNNRENSVEGVSVIAEEIEGIDYISNNVFIGTLDSDSSEEASFSVVSQNIGNYNLSFKVEYKNGDNFHNTELSIPIEITQNYDVAPVIYSFPKTITKGETGDIRLEVYNAKTESISGVLVIPSSDISVSPSKYFIGSMDPDDVFSASFDIDTTELDIGKNYTVDFKVSFKQGNSYYETESVGSTFSVLKISEKQGTNPLIYLLIFVVFIILIYILIRFFKKRRISK